MKKILTHVRLNTCLKDQMVKTKFQINYCVLRLWELILM